MLRTEARVNPRINPVAIGQAGFAILLLLLWQTGASLALIDSSISGSPLGVIEQGIASLSGTEIWLHAAITLYEQIAGFAIGVGLGTACALSLWWLPRTRAAVDPMIAVFNAVPKIALAPPMIIWFGIFETSKIALAALLCLTIAWMSASEGIRRVDPDQMDMIRAMGGKSKAVFLKVVLPASTPQIIASLKINIGFALVGAVVGEFVSSNHGLGYMAVQASNFFQIDKLWLVILVIAAIASIQYFVVLKIEKRLLHWSGEV